MTRPIILAVLTIAAWPAMAENPPRLSGIVADGPARIALLSPAGGGTVPLEEGEALGRYTVQHIGRDTVVLEEGGKLLTLGFGAPTTAPRLADAGGATFGLAINPPAPAPD